MMQQLVLRDMVEDISAQKFAQYDQKVSKIIEQVNEDFHERPVFR